MKCPHHKADCFISISQNAFIIWCVSLPLKSFLPHDFSFLGHHCLICSPSFLSCIFYICSFLSYTIYLWCWRWRRQTPPKWWYISVKLHSDASLRIVTCTEKLNYLLGFYDLKLFYLCSAVGRQGETWSWSPLSRRGRSVCGQTSYGQQPQQEQVRATLAG